MRCDLEWKSAQKKMRSGGKKVQWKLFDCSFHFLHFSLFATQCHWSCLRSCSLLSCSQWGAVARFRRQGRQKWSYLKSSSIFPTFLTSAANNEWEWLTQLEILIFITLGGHQSIWIPIVLYISTFIDMQESSWCCQELRNQRHMHAKLDLLCCWCWAWWKCSKLNFLIRWRSLSQCRTHLHSHCSCFASRHLIIRIKVLLFANICTINLISCRKSPARSLIVACYRVVECVDGFCESALWLASLKTCTERY